MKTLLFIRKHHTLIGILLFLAWAISGMVAGQMSLGDYELVRVK